MLSGEGGDGGGERVRVWRRKVIVKRFSRVQYPSNEGDWPSRMQHAV